MLIKYGDLQPLTVIEPVDVSDDATKKALQKAKEKTNKKSDEINPNNSELL